MSNLCISQNSSVREEIISSSDTTLLVENGLMMIVDTSGVTYIAIGYENLNYIIELIESGKYDKKKIKQLKKISDKWRESVRKKDKVIEEQNTKIHQYIEIRINQKNTIELLENNISDLEMNLSDCEQKQDNMKQILDNKDLVIEDKNKRLGSKNRKIITIIIVAIGLLVLK